MTEVTIHLRRLVVYLTQDYKDIIELFNKHNVKYLIDGENHLIDFKHFTEEIFKNYLK